MLKNNNNSIKAPSYRIAHCGNFPNYSLNGVSFHEKNLIYLVSVGKEKFENKWVERFVNFVKEVKPQKVLIVVADSLQRFNIEVDENLSETEAFQESINRGEIWVGKYKSFFSTLEVKHEFIFWEQLKKNKDYHKYFSEIKTWNESDDFNALILESVKAYINRYDRKLYENRAIEQSTKFLNEECAVLRVLAKDIDNIGIFYPGPPLKIFDYIIDYANKTRSHDPFFYKELFPTKTKSKKKQNDSRLKLFEELPFFNNKLSIDIEKIKNDCSHLPKFCP